MLVTSDASMMLPTIVRVFHDQPATAPKQMHKFRLGHICRLAVRHMDSNRFKRCRFVNAPDICRIDQLRSYYCRPLGATRQCFAMSALIAGVCNRKSSS